MISILMALAIISDQYATGVPVTVFGLGGGYSCAKSFEPSHSDASFVWIMGYISGRNVSESAKVGASTDGEGFVGEVRKVCADEPSMMLFLAADRVYLRMRASHR